MAANSPSTPGGRTGLGQPRYRLKVNPPRFSTRVSQSLLDKIKQQVKQYVREFAND
jgi:hypothetical protein